MQKAHPWGEPLVGILAVTLGGGSGARQPQSLGNALPVARLAGAQAQPNRKARGNWLARATGYSNGVGRESQIRAGQGPSPVLSF